MRFQARSIVLSLIMSIGLAAPVFADTDDTILSAMNKELTRSFAKLKMGAAPLYFLAYRIYDTQTTEVTATYGSLTDDGEPTHNRILDVEMRVGSQKFDNTHRSRESNIFQHMSMFDNLRNAMPLDNDEKVIRMALWDKTDSAFKTAENQYATLKVNKDVTVEEEDTSDDFSNAKPIKFYENPLALKVDRSELEAKIKRLSAIYRKYPEIRNSSVSYTVSLTRRYLLNTEGSSIVDNTLQYRFFTVAEAAADDGMSVWLYDSAEGSSAGDIPDEAKLTQMIEKLAEDTKKLRVAQVAEPYAGPAILRSKAAGVFFHEIFGHRIEGHRQKDEDEGRTFTKLVGQRVMPSFISVIDNPTLRHLANKELNGYYRFDAEGVPAQKVVLVDKGILRSFLMGRSPVKGFIESNGHSRGAPGMPPVARQGNLIVESDQSVPYATLREKLIAEVKKQGKPYGLVFDEIAGGFTMTQNFMPQVFALKPLRVWRVYPDGKPDELLRGCDLVGTPLASIERILNAADDVDVFNGTCGAESGPVPVSAASPSLLVQTIEVSRNHKDQNKPPILPPPDRDKDAGKPRATDKQAAKAASKSADEKSETKGEAK
jgi:TldD protein